MVVISKSIIIQTYVSTPLANRIDDITFKFNFANICGLNANLKSVHAHLDISKPNILALSETQVIDVSDLTKYEFRDYNLVRNFYAHRGVAIYVRKDVVYSRLNHYESSSTSLFHFIWLKLSIGDGTTFICFI